MNPEETPIKFYSSGIDMKFFLDFLKITCQLNESVINGNRDFGEDMNYSKLAKNDLVNKLLEQNSKESINNIKNDCGISITTLENENKTSTPSEKKKENRRKSLIKLKTDCTHHIRPKIHPLLSEKLEEIINEGILDSILPFICPSPCIINNCSQLRVNKIKVGDSNINIQKSVHSSNLDAIEKNDIPIEGVSLSKSPRYNENSSSRLKESKVLRRKSIVNSQTNNDERKGEPEVIIHVCDEVKNVSRDFSCPQNLLIDKMGYFAYVTAGQKLEDMDISVHCDIQIFEWLMKWVKKDANQYDNWPQLDAVNVVPILVSASFLQMEPLLLDCLTFCHSRLNEVVRLSTNLSCLNDSIITRLSAMFTNLELEMVKDKKERITPRLWIKMIQSLCELEPQALRGHYFSLAGLFRCNKCGKYLTQSASPYINCISSNMRLNRWGQLTSKHSRDPSWQITHYVGLLFKELKSWRKVYWKLWGHCHYLFCCICEQHFPIYQMNWCKYHSENPQFLGPISEGKMTGPAGRYPCCGQQAFRYEALPEPNGCQYREHSVIVETDRDRSIMTLAQVASEGDCLYDTPPVNSSENENCEPRWNGITLIPIKCRQGLLPPLFSEDTHVKGNRRLGYGITYIQDSSSETDTASDSSEKKLFWQVSTSSDGSESEYSSPRLSRQKEHIKLTKVVGASGRYWSGEMSARSNQDNQRDFEEKIMKQVFTLVHKKIGNDAILSSYNSQHYPGGTYVRLEAEWKEQLKQKSFNKQKLK